MSSPLEPALASLHLFGDATRVRLMSLVEQAELTVAELTAITNLQQPRVSTHLGKLREAGLLRDRRVGASTFYAVDDAAMTPPARAIWTALKSEIKDDVLEADRRRCESLVKARERDTAWPDAIAGQMERHYSPGRTWEATARALLGVARLGDVLDGGAGDGAIAQLLAQRARSVTCLDRSERLVAAARERLARAKNVRFEVGDLEAMALPDACFDQVLLFNVMTYLARPDAALAEAARVLRPGGELVAVTLEEHSHAEVTAAYQHVNQGFTVQGLRKMAKRAGLEVTLCEVQTRERRPPFFQVINLFAKKPLPETDQGKTRT
jgi:ArsR family transcriptional regulator